MKQGFVSIGSESQVTDHRGHPEFIRTEQKRRNDNNKPAKSGSSGEARFKMFKISSIKFIMVSSQLPKSMID